MKLPLPTWLIFGVSFIIAASSASAQDPGALRVDAARDTSITDRVSSLRDGSSPSNAQNLTGTGTIPALAGDLDFGAQQVIVRRSNYEPWAFSVIGSFAYTTNAALLPDKPVGDIYYRAGAAAAYVPQITGNLFATVTISQNFYWYDKFRDLLDFADFNADVGLLYAMPKSAPLLLQNTAFFARYHLERLTDVNNLSKSFFTDNLIEAGMQRVFRISRGLKFYTGLEADVSVGASEDAPRRNQYAINVGGRIDWTKQFTTNLDVRSAIYDYFKSNRTDWNTILALSAEYRLTDWASVGGSFGWTFNESNKDFFTYNAGTLAAILSFTARF